MNFMELGSSNKTIVLSTGNILSANKKAGQKTTEELFDGLNAILSDPGIDPKHGKIVRKDDDLRTKMTEYERQNIKVGAKVFVNNAEPERLRKAIDNLLIELDISALDNLILAYHPINESTHSNAENGSNDLLNGSSSVPKEGTITWGNGDASFANLKKLWQILEEYVDKANICHLGIADLDADTLTDLYEWCRVKPVIAQINLSTCCVVPPEMQEFCAKHDIQLLTHSDSEEIVSNKTFAQLNGNMLEAYTPTWTARYQVHIKCRGVLTAKGFIIGAKCC